MAKASTLDADLVAACRVGMNTIKATLKERNQAVHSLWYHEYDDPADVFTIAPKTNGLIPETTTWDLDKFKRITSDLQLAHLIGPAVSPSASRLVHEPLYRNSP